MASDLASQERQAERKPGKVAHALHAHGPIVWSFIQNFTAEAPRRSACGIPALSHTVADPGRSRASGASTADLGARFGLLPLLPVRPVGAAGLVAPTGLPTSSTPGGFP